MKEKIERLLSQCSSPARYAGGEFGGPVIKPSPDFRFLMCFPDSYEVGMSNLGIKILNGILNERPDTASEYAFAPMPDMAKLMTENGIPLFSLSTRTPVKDFDMVGISLASELSYTNIPYVLELSGIPLYAKDRGDADPLVIAGGACMVNPFPVLPFFDLVCVGDGEEALQQVADAFIDNKKAGGDKRSFLEKASRIEGIMAPAICKKARRAVLADFENAYFPVSQVVPNTESVHNRGVLELFRGCSRGCRFCQAGFTGRPVRSRSPEKLLTLAKGLIAQTGYEEMSLSSLSTCDYPRLKELLQGLKPLCRQSGTRISLPSTRVDSFEAEYTESARKGSLTFAPEAGTQALRDVINKNVTEEDILSSCQKAFAQGYATVKLYFMIGLPTETDEDLIGIAELCKKIKSSYKYYAKNKKGFSLSVSASTFVPKPFTPFQWEKQIPYSEILRKQTLLKDLLRPLGVRFASHPAGISKAEAVLARGDESLAPMIEAVYNAGGRFDNWSEYFDFDRWKTVFIKEKIDLENYEGIFNTDSPLPWDGVDIGLTKEFLLSERNFAMAGKLSKGCEAGCRNCGIKQCEMRGKKD